MKKGTIQLKDGNYISIGADYIERGEEFVSLWNGDKVVAFVRLEKVDCVYLTEKHNDKEQ